ncbi:hypothetical protein QQS21_011162 [Conoideocrella luteorostrata]|uniref:Histidine kinase n=1 Tax=Conoideocrella luteorostrata TaxID=1105319 RepID=A0AAJ0FU00_9HYPO|nr:hypothetical protein QQS21_011162 [Conoideocrella luteorostrata]
MDNTKTPSSQKTGSLAVTPIKQVSELARERETFKYEPWLPTDSRINATGRPLNGSELSSSKDTVLTALAQLGTHRTATERAFISLFDATYQYVIAEATPSVSLVPGLSSNECPDGLRLCGTAIPRGHAVCEHVLYETGPGPVPDQSQGVVELPISLVPELNADDRLLSRACHHFGSSFQFYAGVPIRSSRGINIGVFCVVSSTRVGSWDSQYSRALREISGAIMNHLEANRSKLAYRRNERINRGLGSFIEGKSTLSGWQHGPNPALFADNLEGEGALNATQQHLEHQDKGPRDEDPDHLMSGSATLTNWFGSPRGTFKDGTTAYFDATRKPRTRQTLEQSETLDAEERNWRAVFSRASNIIREAFEVEGCLFLDVTLGSYRRSTVQSPLGDDTNRDTTGQMSASSSSDEQLPVSPEEAPDAMCELLGFSTSERSSIDAAAFARNTPLISKRFLAKLLRRYPEGKIFNFDSTGELQSSDSSEDDMCIKSLMTSNSSIVKSVHDVSSFSSSGAQRQSEVQSRRIQDGALIHEALLGARSVAFIPVWDSRRERWLSGGFVYTHTPTRVFTIEGELSLLKAVTKLIAAEVQNVQTQQADQAKSDALGSLSHELRSPLHGVILGTELLNDTDLSVFQGNATHTIETCCRTLLDTIDHLLDYTKINSFASQHNLTKRRTASSPRRRGSNGSEYFGKKNLSSNTRLDRLVEEVIESIFAGYNFQQMSVKQLSRQTPSATQADTAAHQEMDTAQAMEQLGPNMNGSDHGGGEHRLHFGNVAVYLLIDPTCNWMLRVPSGAIRRIVMNLFGNSLKYTANGSIWVSLSQDKATSRRPRSERKVKLTIEDTGKGVSLDFIRHRLFKPFAQEDEFASGTGLGLSLVKKIVSALRGQISVESKVGIGTKISVILPLEQSPRNTVLPEEDESFEQRVRELSGLRARLHGFSPTTVAGRSGQAIVERICRDTLRLHVIPDGNAEQLAPDVVLWWEDALPESLSEVRRFGNSPNVVVCQDALATYRRFSTYESSGHSGVFDFISQPIGPRKLAKAIQLAYRRWIGLPKVSLPAPRPPMSLRSRGSFNVSMTKESPLSVPLSASEESKKVPAATLVGSSQSEPPTSIQKEPPLQDMTSKGDKSLQPSKKFLLADDNNINLKILSAYMGKLGCSYAPVVNGKEAVDMYKQHHDDFVGILMDISMPVMDGLEATRQIRSFEHQNQIQPVAIVALTGLAANSTQREALESGVNVFRTKPIRLKELNEILASLNIFPEAQASGAGRKGK